MVRVLRRPASALARRPPSRTTKRSLRKHKVILESITQEKKKLRSVISFEAKPPPGYTFIPAGNPQLTGACKELCRNDGLKVYAVTVCLLATSLYPLSPPCFFCFSLLSPRSHNQRLDNSSYAHPQPFSTCAPYWVSFPKRCCCNSVYGPGFTTHSNWECNACSQQCCY